jgi:hypothetical protein
MGLLKKSGRDFLYYSRFILPVAAASILLTVCGVGWFTEPDRFVLGYEPAQPIPFSHALHPGTLRIPCTYCHAGVLKSRHAGIPSVEKCMNCHRVTKTDSPEIRKLAAAYDTAAPFPWVRIHNLPDYVFFDHRPHVHAGVLCQTCHGEVEDMIRVRQHMSMRMSHCLGCHRDPKYALPEESEITKGPEYCNACHR